MPAKKKESSTTKSEKTTKISKTKKPNQFEVVVSTAIDKLTKIHETFATASTSSSEAIQALIQNYLTDLTNRINLKREELEYLEEDFANKRRAGEIDIDLNIKQYGRDAAIRILKDSGEIPIGREDYENLKTSYNSLLETKDSEIKLAVEAENKRNEKHVAILKQTLELKNRAEVATVEAKLEAQVQQIQLLNDTIAQMKDDLNEQRKLTKDVADASSKGAQMYYPPPQISSK